MGKIVDYLWNSLVTAILFLISIVFSYQIIFNYDDLILSILIAIIITLAVRYIITNLLNSVEINFNIFREIIIIITCSIITYFIFLN